MRVPSVNTGFYFRHWRKFRGLTQEQLAERIGLTASTISQIESGKQWVSDTTLLRIAAALDCLPGDLLSRDPNDDDAPWSLWQRVKDAPDPMRSAIVAGVEAMLRHVETAESSGITIHLAAHGPADKT